MSPAPQRRVTLYDVASQAGVSYQTVSRVINANPHVSDETRQRVLQAIKELNYQPNHAARSLVTRRSQTLEVITFGSHYYGPSQMVVHVERAARRLGYSLILSNISDMTLDAIRAAIDSLSGRLVDGLILVMPVVGVEYAELALLCRGIPFVLLDTCLAEDTPSVYIDQRYGGRLAAQHLIDLGHRHISEISGPLNWFGAIARHESWLAALDAVGIPPGPSVEGDWTAVSGYWAAKRLVEDGAQFSALVVGNDQMALGAMRGLRECGLAIPGDVSVVGFDDVPEAMCFEPPLTTIQQDFEVLGQETVEYLVELIGEGEVPLRQRVLPPRLIVRDSTQPFT